MNAATHADRTTRRLLLLAHGSRREAANDEVRALTARLAARLAAPDAGGFVEARCAFLELAEPDIPTGLDAAAALGPGTVVVLPYFLVQGRHVVDDVAAALAACRARHPDVHFELTPCVGESSLMLDLLAGLADAEADQ